MVRKWKWYLLTYRGHWHVGIRSHRAEVENQDVTIRACGCRLQLRPSPGLPLSFFFGEVKRFLLGSLLEVFVLSTAFLPAGFTRQGCCVFSGKRFLLDSLLEVFVWGKRLSWDSLSGAFLQYWRRLVMPHVLVNDISVLFHHNLQVGGFPQWPLGQCRFLPQRLDRAPDSGQHVCVGLRTRMHCRHCPRAGSATGRGGLAAASAELRASRRFLQCRGALLCAALVVSRGEPMLCCNRTRGLHLFISYTETSHLERAEGKRSDRMAVETGFLSSLAELSVTAR